MRLCKARRRLEEPPKRKKAGTESGKMARKANTQPGKESGRKNREPQLGTRVSSLMQVQKENSPKTVRTRPAALRRGPEKQKTRHGRREEASESKHATGKGIWQEKPGTAAGNAGVKFDAGSKGKLAQNRPDETRGPPKRPRKAENQARTTRRSLEKQTRNRERNLAGKPGNRSWERECQV